MAYSKEQITDALRHVDDPDIRKDLISLGMIDDIKIDGKKVSFSLVLTTPACPLKNKIKNDCIDAIHKYVNKEAEVIVNVTSKVTSARTQQKEEILPDVKNIIAVASGKGGVGKSTVASNLAVALAKTGARVGLIDADIYGPSIPLMFDVTDEAPHVIESNGKNKIIPIVRHGVHLLSMGFFVDKEKALIWRGPMASGALTQLFTDADWGALDYMIIDMPPGTGDIQITLVQKVKVTGIVVVSTPQKVALADAIKAVSMFRSEAINVPVLGLVENMAYFTPAELPNNKYYIFGKEGCKKLAESLKIPFLGQIPIIQSICESGDEGVPAVMQNDSVEAKAFMVMAENVAQQVAIINAK